MKPSSHNSKRTMKPGYSICHRRLRNKFSEGYADLLTELKNPNFTGKMINAIRFIFGGHRDCSKI